MKKCCNSGCKARCLRFAILGLIGIAVVGLVVMLLWNWLLPALFGWQEIGYLQAVGLLVLSKILFGHFGCRRHCHHRGELGSLTPEEREKLRSGMCCGHGEEETAEAKKVEE